MRHRHLAKTLPGGLLTCNHIRMPALIYEKPAIVTQDVRCAHLGTGRRAPRAQTCTAPEPKVITLSCAVMVCFAVCCCVCAGGSADVGQAVGRSPAACQSTDQGAFRLCCVRAMQRTTAEMSRTAQAGNAPAKPRRRDGPTEVVAIELPQTPQTLSAMFLSALTCTGI